MKFYLRNFILVLFLAFGSLFCWLIFLNNSNLNNLTLTSSNSRPPNIIKNFPTSSDAIKHFLVKLQNTTSTTASDSFIPYQRPHHQRVNNSAKTLINNNNNNNNNNAKKIRNILCKINGEYKINCLKLINGQNSSIFVPFSFLHKYFEINGKIINPKSQDEYFEWSHSYSKIVYPDEPYDPSGKFLWFGNYNVEFRDRVKCISAIDNVPISTQWYPDGHLYPTQISQYGLSHFTKNITAKKPDTLKLIQFGKLSSDVAAEDNTLSITKQNYLILNGDTPLVIKKNFTNFLIAQFEIKIKQDQNVSLSLIVANTRNVGETYKMVYSTVDNPIELKNNRTVIYGIGSKSSSKGWFLFTRDLLVDLFKGNLISERKRSQYYLSQIHIDGGTILMKNFYLKTSAHEEFALQAAEWLIQNQNNLGGWKIKVKRKLANGELVIKEGWHSAMGQGHAISLLTRLYRTTNDLKYLNAAKKALKIFELESFKNGVKAMLFDKFIWYEEYPTVPSIFVLNGFIYSLFGLYDLSKACQDHDEDSLCHKSSQLFEEGLRSLEAALPLYDSGSGSFYDLRHLTLGIAPNLARWDYHSTHINQLLFLYTITRQDLLQSTAERWIGYMNGHRASHN